MKWILALANRYLKESDWKDLVQLKLCVCGFGLLVGALLPQKARKPVALAAEALFVLTLIPIMARLFFMVVEKKDAEHE